jgi:hypothetical protein
MKEKWIEYISEKIPIGKYELLKVTQDIDGTVVMLESKENFLIIKFDFVDALRICDEGRRIRTYNDAEGIQVYRKDFCGTPLYQVHNSQFYEWLVEESVGFYDDFKHYAIITLNDIVDILTSSTPFIEVKKKVAE